MRALLVMLVWGAVVFGQTQSSTATLKETQTPSFTPTPSSSRTETPTGSGTPSITPTDSETRSATRSTTPTPSSTRTETSTYSGTPSQTITNTGSATLTPTPSTSTTPTSSVSSSPTSTPCPPGSLDSTVTGSSSCQPCAPGSFCPNSTAAFPCPVGRFGDASGAWSLSACRPCPLGSFCPSLGAAAPIPCPAGRFGESLELKSASCDGPCSPGYYCPPSSTKPESQNCSEGYYGTSTGRTSRTCTGLCQAGYYGGALNESYPFTSPTCAGQCDAGRYGLPNTVRISPLCDGPCAAGFFCPAGSSTSTANICPAGYYCPLGSGSPLPCPGGTEGRTPKGASREDACKPCRSGTYGESEALNTCSQCYPGRFAPSPGSTSSAACVHCPAGTFSSGAFPCQTCPPGFTTSSNGSIFCVQCGQNNYGLVNGTCAPCPAGKYNEIVGSGSADFCKPCPAGYFSRGSGVLADNDGDGAPESLCARCPPGKFTAMPGSAECLGFTGSMPRCPEPLLPYRSANETVTACVGCPAGFYGSCRPTDANLSSVALAGLGLPDGAPWWEAPLERPAGTRFGVVYAADTNGGVCNLAVGHSSCARCPNGTRCPGFSALPLLELGANAVCSGLPALRLPSPSPPPEGPLLGLLSRALGKDLPSPLAQDIIATNALVFLITWMLVVPIMYGIALTKGTKTELDKKLVDLICCEPLLDCCISLRTKTNNDAQLLTLAQLRVDEKKKWRKVGLCRRALLFSDADTFRAGHDVSGLSAGHTDASSKQENNRVPVIQKAHSFGGACSLTGIWVFAGLCSHFLLSRDLNNVTTTNTLLLLDASTRATMIMQGGNAAWRGFGTGAAAADTGPTLLVTLLAAGEGGRCGGRPLSPANTLPWTHSETDCAEEGRFLHRFACTGCALTPASALLLELDPACQTLSLEAAAIDATLNITHVTSALNASAATGLIKQFNWTLGSVLSLAEDQRAPFAPWLPGVAAPDPVTRLGYHLVPRTAVPVFEEPGGDWSKFPTLDAMGSAVPGRSARLTVAVHFPLEAFFSSTTYTQTTSMLDKLNAVSAFWAVFLLFASFGKATPQCARRRSKASPFTTQEGPSAGATPASSAPDPPTPAAQADAPAQPPFDPVFDVSEAACGKWRRQTRPDSNVVWHPDPNCRTPGRLEEKLPWGAKTTCGWEPWEDESSSPPQRWWVNSNTNESSWYPPSAVTWYRPSHLEDGQPAWKRIFKKEGLGAEERKGLREKVSLLPEGAVTLCRETCPGKPCTFKSELCGWRWTSDGENAPVWKNAAGGESETPPQLPQLTEKPRKAAAVPLSSQPRQGFSDIALAARRSASGGSGGTASGGGGGGAGDSMKMTVNPLAGPVRAREKKRSSSTKRT